MRFRFPSVSSVNILYGAHTASSVNEIPVILIVFASESWLWIRGSPGGIAFTIMLIAGAMAIAANAYCVWLVFRRRDAAHLDNWAAFDRLDDLQHKVGAVVLLGILVAVVAGVVGRAY